MKTHNIVSLGKEPTTTLKLLTTAALSCILLAQSESSAAPKTIQPPPNNSASKQNNLLAELRKLQKLSAKNSSIEASFEQKTFNALRKKITTSVGTLQFSQPRMFRWEVTSPRAELYVTNDKWFWKYTESTKHALRMPASSNELQFLDVIFNFETLPNKFVVSKVNRIEQNEFNTRLECTGRMTCFELTPQTQERHRQITIAIDTQTGFAKLLFIEFRNGNKTEISFSQYKQYELNKRIFDFSPPPGTAIDKR